MGTTMRLDKFLGQMGKGSRSQIKEMAKKGRIFVNGQAEKKTERKICPETDEVTLDGCKIDYMAFEYYMLNKPSGGGFRNRGRPVSNGSGADWKRGAKGSVSGRASGCGYGRAAAHYQ